MQKIGNRQKTVPRLEQFKAEVEKRATEIFLKRQETKVSGDALSDWLQAEKEIKTKYRIP
jgi:hypothetical protein